VSEAGEGNDADDGIHPLDRDYSKPVSLPQKNFLRSKSRAITLGLLGFGVAGVILFIGIILSQVGDGNQSMESMAASAHRLGMWCILFGGCCVIFAMQTRKDKPRRRRKVKNEVQQATILAQTGDSMLHIQEWKSALEEFDHLVVSQLAMDCLRPECEDVYLGVDGVVLAVLRWDGDVVGVVRVRFRRRDLVRVRQGCLRLLMFLDAQLVDDATGDVC
jgi:hypothetical protein